MRSSNTSAEVEFMDDHQREHLWSPSVIRSLLRQYGISSRRSLGQRFLADQNVLNRILKVADLQPCHRVLEIGSGLGILTRALAQRAGHVVALDIDPIMASISRSATQDFSNVEIREGDIRDAPLRDLLGDFPRGKCHIVANLPYNISKPALRKFIEEREAFSHLTVMVQKEVAQRIVAQPGSADYGPMAIAYQLYGKARIAGTVSKDCFFPPPEVDSALVRVELQLGPRYPMTHEDRFFDVVRSAFRERRKTLMNALESNLTRSGHPRSIGATSSKICLTREELRERIAAVGIDPRRRGETLTVEEFIRLAERLYLNHP